MFAGGGVALPQQMMPQQQQPMMPQQQPGGILASSGDLINSVTQAAINPDGDGGASLSEVQGFQNGGFANGDSFDAEVMTGAAYRQPKDFSRELEGATDEQLQQLMTSIDPRSDAENVLPQVRAELSRRAAGSANSRAGADEFGSRVYDASSGAVVDSDVARQVSEMSGQVVGGVDPSMTAGERIQETLSEGLLAAEEAEILDEGSVEDARMKQLLADRNAFRYNLSRVRQGGVAAGENFDPAASTEFVDPDDPGRDPGRSDARVQSPETVAAALKMQERYNYESAGKDADKVFRERYRSGFSEKNPIIGSQDGEVYEEGPSGGGPSKAAEAAKFSNLQGVLTEDMYGFPESGTESTADGTPESAEAAMSNADARAELAKIDPFAAAEFEGEDIDAETNEIDSMRGLNTSELKDLLGNRAGGKDSPAQTSSAAVTKTIADYSKDFADAMPAYEGMSDSEKGFAIMEAGLRIMAGQSSNALTNIAEGLKGLGPKFAKDAKERRAWNRQIDLSAAKYGLENVARETAEIKADIRAGRKLYNNVFTVKPGETFEYNGKINGPGSTIILKVSDVRDGAVDLSSLQTEKRDLAAIKAHAAQTTARLKALQGSAISPNKFATTSKQYVADSMRLRTNVATQSLLSRALVELQKSGGAGPLGIKATAKNAILKLANAFGGKQYAESAFGKLDSQVKFDDFTNRAVTTQIEGLINEGGKITDQERRLAKEIGGALSKGAWSGIFEDKDKLENQILEFSQALDRDSETRFRSMALSEKAWSQHYRSASDAKSGFSYGDLLRESRPDLQSSASPRASGVLPKELNWRDFLNIDKNGGKITFKKGWKK